MPTYRDQNFQPLSPIDWEKIEVLNWPKGYRKQISEFLYEIRKNGSIPERHEWIVSNTIYRAYDVSSVLNTCFNKHGLPYRCFKAEYAGDTYIFGVVKPIKKKIKKLKKEKRRAIAISDLMKAARILTKKLTPKNIAGLRRVLKNPDLPQ